MMHRYSANNSFFKFIYIFGWLSKETLVGTHVRFCICNALKLPQKYHRNDYFLSKFFSNAHNLGPGMAVKIKFAIISALFDYNPKLIDAMKPDSWEKEIDHIMMS